MPFSIVLHILNAADPVLGEVDELPAPADRLIIVNNPRRLDGKELSYIDDRAATVIWPVDKINFVEVLSGEADEDLIGFVRE
jgi:hypothetical protein